MGNRHNKQRCCIHYYLDKKDIEQQKRNASTSGSCSRSMLPILCSSINDTVLPPLPSINQNKEEPLSPKVSCMGQVKKKKNQRSNRVSATHHPMGDYSKLTNLFSAKNLLLLSSSTSTSIIKTTTAGGGGIRSNSCVGPRSTTTTNSTSRQQQLSFIREMDPPLPVLLTNNNKNPQQHQDNQSTILWKRRFGDVSSLQTLDLNQLTTPLPLTL